ncbi:hypothetical protein [Halomonas hibernica]|uniref:hypothetical protein n=1 Tax=Halomonas hibernica TaxID=2591147 RepID=UPI0015552ED7|nr:hypothetical protein [Halomonas hibernica]
MDKIAEIATIYSEDLPWWFSDVFWNLLAVFLVLSIIMAILRIVRSAIFRESSKSLLRFLGSASKKFLMGAFSQLESPIERPKTKLVIKTLEVIHTYLMAVIFFFLFALVFSLVVVLGLPNDLLGQLGALGLLILFLYIAIFFRAEADRVYLSLKECWRKYRDRGD